MMKRSSGRRALLIAAGTAAVAAAAGPAAAQAADLRGSVVFEGGVNIPPGQLDIYVEDPSTQHKADRRIAEARIDSDGKSTLLAFSVALPSGVTVSAKQRIVVRLERTDGWLLARGSSQVVEGALTDIELREVKY